MPQTSPMNWVLISNFILFMFMILKSIFLVNFLKFKNNFYLLTKKNKWLW